MSNPHTIRQIATAAGVSIATVSLALRNHPRISEATRQRVLKVAKEQGYTPDPLVSTLMNKLRTSRVNRNAEKIAYMTFWDTPDEWRQNYNDFAYFTGACERAAQTGYEIEHFWAREPGISSARLSRILYTRGIRGIVFAPFHRPNGHLSLDWKYFACSALGFSILRPCLHRTSHYYQEGMKLSLRMLKRHCYKRIGFANFTVFDKRAQHGWLSGYLVYMNQLPLKRQIPPLLVPADRTKGIQTFPKSPEIRRQALTPNLFWNPESFYNWLDQYQPDVVISNTIHPLAFMKERGIRVPEDIGFASLDRVLDTDPWAGVNQRPKNIGGAAVDLVASQLQNNEYGLPPQAKYVMLEGTWEDGPTIR